MLKLSYEESVHFCKYKQEHPAWGGTTRQIFEEASAVFWNECAKNHPTFRPYIDDHEAQLHKQFVKDNFETDNENLAQLIHEYAILTKNQELYLKLKWNFL